MRLIDADAIIEWAKKDMQMHIDEYHESKSIEQEKKRFLAIKNAVDKAPTIDAKPVVRGHWENVHTISAGLFLRNREDFAESKCSVCGLWTVRLARCINDSYCPHCGADMRKRKEVQE